MRESAAGINFVHWHIWYKQKPEWSKVDAKDSNKDKLDLFDNSKLCFEKQVASLQYEFKNPLLLLCLLFFYSYWLGYVLNTRRKTVLIHYLLKKGKTFVVFVVPLSKFTSSATHSVENSSFVICYCVKIQNERDFENIIFFIIYPSGATVELTQAFHGKSLGNTCSKKWVPNRVNI